MSTNTNQRYHADNETSNGEGNNATKYILYRSLANRVPTHVEQLMSDFDETYIGNRRLNLDRSEILDIKESIDDYLGDVQYRVLDRLDESSFSRLTNYISMDIFRLVDKLNSLPVEERITQLIYSYEKKL